MREKIVRLILTILISAIAIPIAIIGVIITIMAIPVGAWMALENISTESTEPKEPKKNRGWFRGFNIYT